jgi:hypothetical protein
MKTKSDSTPPNPETQSLLNRIDDLNADLNIAKNQRNNFALQAMDANAREEKASQIIRNLLTKVSDLEKAQVKA